MPSKVGLTIAGAREAGMRYFAILLCMFIWGAARAGDRPIPQLDTGGHMAIIRGIAFTQDGKQLVSAGRGQSDPGVGPGERQDGSYH